MLPRVYAQESRDGVELWSGLAALLLAALVAAADSPSASSEVIVTVAAPRASHAPTSVRTGIA
jgi:hypothetical protein